MSADVRASCEALIFSFAHHIDHHEFDLAIAQFAEDGVFERPDGTLNGHGEMGQFWGQRSAAHITRHLCHRPFFTEIGATQARAITQTTLYNATRAEGAPVAKVNGPLGIVEFHDTFILGENGWRIAHRRAVPVLVYNDKH